MSTIAQAGRVPRPRAVRTARKRTWAFSGGVVWIVALALLLAGVVAVNVAVLRLNLQLDAVTMELRRRVGGTFTLRELAAEYARADAWTRSALAERAAPGWPRTLSLVEGAAFHLYSRGAADYAP